VLRVSALRLFALNGNGIFDHWRSMRYIGVAVF